MSYPIADALERSKVEEIHGLTGGEMADRPLRFAYTTIETMRWDSARGAWDSTPRTIVRRGWARYWYDGAPEWSDEHAYDGGRGGWRGSWKTLVWDSGAYGDYTPPDRIRVDGRTWRKVKTYNSGSECDCPVPENHGSKVTRREARLTPKLETDSPLRHMPRPFGRPYTARHAECPMCESRIGEEHGSVYLGEGWIEVVYHAIDPRGE